MIDLKKMKFEDLVEYGSNMAQKCIGNPEYAEKNIEKIRDVKSEVERRDLLSQDDWEAEEKERS
ncbi:hypothetical protein COB55_03160 [Candidatus Wolfebacteria bacterium]|nr:MAG: hypothetical protein COB55_03160 [Candidatus Wolfebacteria bacterium]